MKSWLIKNSVMICDTINKDKKELEYREFIMNSIECALKRGDEILDKLISKEHNINKPEVNKK